MKNKTILLIISVLLLINGLKAQYETDRRIYFVHGIGGTYQCWNKAAQMIQTGVFQSGDSFSFSPRKVQSVQLQYDETIDFPVAVQSLYQQMSYTPLPTGHIKSSDFVIAHSQGGLVVRSLDRAFNISTNGYTRQFGGIVTFGTPHGGAAIISDLGLKLNTFISTFCTNLTAGPVREKLDNAGLSFPIKIFSLEKTFEDFRSSACNGIGGLTGAFVNFKIPILSTYYTSTSSYLWNYGSGYCSGANTGTPGTGLNYYTSIIPKVAFYGIEDKSGICAKTLYSFTVGDANEQGPFNAGSTDALAMTEFNNMLNRYNAKVIEFQNKYNTSGFWGMFHQEKFLTIRDDYQLGVNLLNSADNLYENVVGAISIGYTTVSSYRCKCSKNTTTSSSIITSNDEKYDLSTMYNVPPEGFSSIKTEDNAVKSVVNITKAPSEVASTEKLGPNPCGDGCTTIFIHTTYASTITADSDGIVLTNSALKFPGCTYNILMQGSNHNQMKNDSNTKTCLNNLFSGAYGAYFSTAIR